MARRRHGLQTPIAREQIAAITVVIFNCAVFGGFVYAALEEGVETPVFAALFYVSWIGVAAFGVATMLVDPADPAVLEETTDSKSEDMKYCFQCSRSVDKHSRHCWTCQKCVQDFDHHCPYLNTCVGSQNYRIFFVLIWQVLFMLSVMGSLAILLLVRAVQLDLWDTVSVTRVIFYSITFALDGGLLLLVAYLVLLHCFLCYKGLTTYQWIKGLPPAERRSTSKARGCSACLGACAGGSRKGKAEIDSGNVLATATKNAAMESSGKAETDSGNLPPTATATADIEIDGKAEINPGNTPATQATAAIEIGGLGDSTLKSDTPPIENGEEVKLAVNIGRPRLPSSESETRERANSADSKADSLARVPSSRSAISFDSLRRIGTSFVLGTEREPGVPVAQTDPEEAETIASSAV
eukprot:TRINITY_DN36635_c0_g1_i1.p1 TRINITY_DN36635_c0_g1~~TRINITY_DN36635_c0_g1_i1.p1  ORF type:complete len:411 (-),score=74.34 TRINITY_DN36635_c0_g1_i1:224-1456(-)